MVGTQQPRVGLRAHFPICHGRDWGETPISSSTEGAPVSPAIPGFQLRGPASRRRSSNLAWQPGPCPIQVQLPALLTAASSSCLSHPCRSLAGLWSCLGTWLSSQRVFLGSWAWRGSSGETPLTANALSLPLNSCLPSLGGSQHPTPSSTLLPVSPSR